MFNTSQKLKNRFKPLTNIFIMKYPFDCARNCEIILFIMGYTINQILMFYSVIGKDTENVGLRNAVKPSFVCST